MKIEKFPNPNCATFHGRRRMIDSRILTFDSKNWKRLMVADNGGLIKKVRRLFFGKGSEEYWEQEIAEKMAHQLMIDELFALDGLVQVSIWPYQVSVQKAKAFDWDTLEPKVVEILSRYRFDEVG